MNAIVAEAEGCKRDVIRAYKVGNISKPEKKEMLRRLEKVLESPAAKEEKED